MATNPFDKVYLDKTKLNTLVNGGSITSGSDTYTADETAEYFLDDTSVLFEEQSLTAEQKAQARTNIGAGTSNFSGSYNDLSDKPTIPTVNNATLTIQKNGATVDTFTANASSNKTINITVPTSASDIGALSSSTKYGSSLSVSGTSVSLKDQDGTVLNTITTQDTTYESKTAASSGTDVSLVTTGEKYTWNNKSNFSGSYTDLSNKPTLGTAAAANTGTSSGNVPVLDTNGKLSTSILPALAITDTFVASTEAAMLALTAQVGDVCVRTDLNKSFILKTDGASTLANWQELLAPTGGVSSVNAKTGAVTLSASDVSALPSSTKYGKTLSVSGTSLSLKDQDGTVLSTVTTQDTTYSSKSASSGGTDVSLVTTGEKYTWNSKSTFSGNYNDLTNKPTILSSAEILNLVYPVGSIYITVGTGTTGSTSPASFLGGTWTRLPEGYALWTASSGAYNGSTGTISAGLPNISGTIENRQYGSSDNSGALFLPTGAISYDIKGGTQTYGTTYNVANYSRKTSLLTIDASQSGADAIYGKSSTVQPPAIKIYGWRRTA